MFHAEGSISLNEMPIYIYLFIYLFKTLRELYMHVECNIYTVVSNMDTCNYITSVTVGNQQSRSSFAPCTNEMQLSHPMKR